MKYRFLATALIATFIVLIGINVSGSAQDAKIAQDKKSTTAKSAKPDAGKKAPIDAKGQAELLQMLDNLVKEKDPVKLGATAKKLGDELLASLEYERAIAKLSIQETLLEQARGDGMSAAQDAAKERKQLKGQLEKNLDDLKRQHKDDSKLADSEMVARIQVFRPTLLTLKHQEEEFAKVVKETSEKLSRVRNQKLRLEQEFELVKLGVLQRKAIIIPPIGPGGIGDIEMPSRLPSTGTKESLQKALESLKDL